ncbi:MAG: hypothetical protein D6704_06735 [Nitrospirae bacterium]|nr:MAG: hypothetical protein D6704_06735 [Nitrospirota bacterium]
MEGLRFERRGDEHHYKVILHVGDCYVPVSDDIVDELKHHSAKLGDGLLGFFLEKVGYSSYLRDQIQQELSKLGDPAQQISTIRQALLQL